MELQICRQLHEMASTLTAGNRLGESCELTLTREHNQQLNNISHYIILFNVIKWNLIYFLWASLCQQLSSRVSYIMGNTNFPWA